MAAWAEVIHFEFTTSLHLFLLFKSIEKIDYYLSGVGYNESPFPYALDKKNNIYIFTYGITLSLSDNIFKKVDNYPSPYDFMTYFNKDNIDNKDEIKTGLLIDYCPIQK